MKQFFYDMIHNTNGENLIKYWWLWLIYLLIIVAVSYSAKRRRK